MEGKEDKDKKQILESVGYGRIARHPKRIVESKGYLEVLNKFLPDDLLAEKHKELLTVPIITKTTRQGEFISREESLDVQAISKGLDMAYKVKGSYAPEKKQSVNLNLNAEIRGSKKAKEIIDKYEQEMANMLKEPKSEGKNEVVSDLK